MSAALALLAGVVLRPIAQDDPERLELQRRSARAFAALVAGPEAGAFDPYLNTWSGEARGRDAPLRRAPAQVDLEELLFSIDRDDELLLARVLRGDALPLDDVSLPPDSSPQPLPSGEPALTAVQSMAWQELLRSRLAAARELAEWLGRGRREHAAVLRTRLDADAARAALLPIAMAESWEATLALDRALVDAAEPWRLRVTTWSVTSPALTGTVDRVTLVRADDPRLGGWAARVEAALGSRTLDLWKLLAVAPGVEVTLRTELALRDARNVRLRVEADARRSVRVNGNEAVAGLSSERGPLLVTLPLPAGANAIEVVLQLDGSGAEVALDLDLLPSRVEGIVLDPERASRVNEPVVRLADPTALGPTATGGSSLVRPLGRPVPRSATEPARASLPFSIAREQRLDTWVHVLPLPDRPAALETRFDDGPSRELPLPAHAGWTWVRAPAPATLPAGDHALHLGFPVENVRVDQVALLPSELSFPRRPESDAPLSATAWRFDPLGAGITLDLPVLRTGELYGRAFTLERGGTFEAYVWLEGSDPLGPGERAELELGTPSGRVRFVLPEGTPYEEWIALGSIVFAAGDRIELHAQGDGALARVAFLSGQFR